MKTAAVVCVDGTGVNGLATVRALGRQGIPVHLVSVRGAPEIVSASRYCSRHHQVEHSAGLARALIRLAQELGGRPVLFIDNDAMIRQLSPQAAALARAFEVVEPLARAEELTDKALQLRTAEEAGIPVPRSWFPQGWAELAGIGRQTGKRLIAKPSPNRFAPGETPPFKAVIAADAAALGSALRARGIAPADILVQEFVEGADQQIYVGLCYRAAGGRAFVLSARKLRQTQPGAGVMAVGQAIDAPQVRAMTERLAARLELRGVLCTEFKLDPADGRFYFIEWNPRPAYFQSLGWKSGFDLALLAYCDHADPDRLPQAPLAHASRHYWINLRGDLQHLSLVPRLALKPATFVPYFAPKEWAVFAADDPRPWLRAMVQLGVALPRGVAKRFAFG